MEHIICSPDSLEILALSCLFVVQRAGEALPSPECYAFVTQARHDRGFSQSEEPAPYAGESKMDDDFTDDQYPELSPNTEGDIDFCFSGNSQA